MCILRDESLDVLRLIMYNDRVDAFSDARIEYIKYGVMWN